LLRLKIILQSKILLYICLIIVISISLIRVNINQKSIYNINDNSFIGIIDNIKIDDDKYTFILKAKENLKCTYYYKDINDVNNFNIGDKVQVLGKLNIPMNNTTPNTFNYKKYLKYNNINYTLTVTNIKIIKKNKNILYILKDKLIKYVDKFKSKSYLNMFIFGNKDELTEGVYEQYQRLSVSHVFAISGMHVSLFSGILLKLLKRLRDNIKYPIVIVFLLFYAYLTNFAASILRSISFFITSFVNKKYDLNLDSINIFILSISILLIIIPNLIVNIGFIYSSVISYGLIKHSSLIKGNYIIKSIKISTIANLYSIPITLRTTYKYNLLGIVNNLIVVPFVSFILYPLSLIILIIKPLDGIYFKIINIFEVIVNKLFILDISFIKLSTITIIIYYILLTIFFMSYEKKYLVLMLITLLFNKYIYLLDNSYYAYTLDVGQGDSILIKHKDSNILIDTGGKVDSNYLYTNNTIMFLKSIGAYQIDYLILTHGDFDHMGEAINLVNNFKVEKVIFNCGEFNELEQELIQTLDKKHIKYYSCISNIDNMYFLQTKEYDNENDNSNVIYTELNGYKFMFMGDASTTTEKEILNKYNLLDIDVLKVGHHGSKTSSGKEFIDGTNPKYSIISVGKNNRYGHPNKEVLDNLSNSKIYRTDQDGSIMFKIKNNKLKIETCSP